MEKFYFETNYPTTISDLQVT